MTSPQPHLPQPLVIQDIPLTGRHLIEASAGTGKTYNITRLYARLLLEQKRAVQEILVVTFTRAATEELRGRIASFLRDLLQQWDGAAEDEFLQAMRQRISAQEARVRLQEAVQNLDEAAIYTIHGYCKRVLTQQAFSSGIPFEVSMEADTSELVLQVIADAWRRLVAEPERYRLVSEGYATPEQFYAAFGHVLASEAPVLTATREDLANEKAQVREAFVAQLDVVRSELIETRKKAEERTQRDAELTQLLNWLAAEPDVEMPSAAADFMHGRRYPKREDLQSLFAPVKALKSMPERCRQSAANVAIADLLVALRVDVQREKQRQRVLDFNDLVTQLRDALHGAHGTGLVQALAQSFPAALLDEFQDTDPQQYAIFDAVYRTEKTAMFMIGDPKQAIYSFRGGDVYAYLNAGRTADHHWSMDTNYRSTPALIQGYNRLFYGTTLPQPGSAVAPSYRVFGQQIGYWPVRDGGMHSKAQQGSESIAHASMARSALQWVHFPTDPTEESATARADFRHQIAAWCAQEVQRLLHADPVVDDVPLREADIAFLVRSRTEAEIVQHALRDAGFAAVFLSARDNVLHSPEADQLAQALTGILHAEDDRLLLAASVTPLFALSAHDLWQLQEDEDAWEQHRVRVIDLREQWQRHGFITMALNLVHDRFRPDPGRHERAMTNMLHLLELLQQASQQETEPWQLLEWLRLQQRAEMSRQEVELRLESDANLIRIITQHSSKGLEYPMVFVPFASYAGRSYSAGIFSFHDAQGQLHWHLGPGASSHKDAATIAQREQDEERVRLLYVAITRAEQRCYVCTAPFARPFASALGLALGLEKGDQGDPWPTALQTLCGRSANQPDEVMSWLTVEHIPDTDAIPRQETHDDPPQVSVFTGYIERHWGLSSFSALARGLNRAQVGYSGLSRRDRDRSETLAEARGERSAKLPLPMRFRLPKGARAGNLLHDTLEHLSFVSPDWSAVETRAVEHFGVLFKQPAAQQELQDWLQACLHAPLNEHGLTLSQLGQGQTLREAEFYFPLQGITGQALARVLQQHRQTLSPDGWEAEIDIPARVLEGMMHGFIDLIFCADGRYYVCDYKSTWLGDRLTDYEPDALHHNIEQHWYDLQYLIYSLALHRYLQHRIPDYDLRTHFGGVYYLYLRGMAPESPGAGVYFVQPDVAMIEQLDAQVSGAKDEVSV